MNALLLLDDGWAAERVAAVLFIDAHGSSQPGLDPQGSDRELKSNHGRVNVNINGALSWPDRAVVHREAARITRAEMILLFNDLQARHPTQTAINVVLDNARYNHSAEIKAYLACDECRIKLVYLPAYAPNLNLIERSVRSSPPRSITSAHRTPRRPERSGIRKKLPQYLWSRASDICDKTHSPRLAAACCGDVGMRMEPNRSPNTCFPPVFHLSQCARGVCDICDKPRHRASVSACLRFSAAN
jgi:transposase